jgi:hypothetical protein
MKLRSIFIFAISILLCCQIVDAQKVILLHKPGKTKRFLYSVGDKISVKLGEPEFTVYGEITYLDDSLCTVNKDYTFAIAKVKEVVRARHFFHANWRKFYLASALYAGGSLINRSINGSKPLIDNTIPIVSGSFVVLGTTALLLRYKHCKMEDNWKMEVLDFDIYNERNGQK